MSVSLGQGLVIAQSNCCPARRPTMPQASRRWISEKVKSLHESDVLPFHEILNAEMVNSALASAGVTLKERIYTPFVTLCMFLSHVLDPDHSCRAALIVWLVVNHRKPCSPETNSFSDARPRLPLSLSRMLDHPAQPEHRAGHQNQGSIDQMSHERIPRIIESA